MGSQSHNLRVMSLPFSEMPLEEEAAITPILDLERSFTSFVLSRAQEALGAQELGINAQQWAHVLGVTDRWIRMWRSGLHPIHKRYILSIAKVTQEYCKRAAARIQSLQTWAEQVVIMSAVDDLRFKGECDGTNS